MFNTRSKKGQALIEAMVAISVLTVSFLGIVSLLSKSIFYGRDVSDNMKATYLASEGIEIAKNLIDNDIAAGNGWGSCFAKYLASYPSYKEASFEMDYATTCDNLNGLFYTYPGDSLYFDPMTDLYGYESNNSVGSDAVETNFARRIRIQVPTSGNGNEITVISSVTWSTGPITYQKVDMEDHFYNLQSQ